MNPIYLDYAATTPVDSEVADAISECLTGEGVFGNPSSATHAFGRRAAAKVEEARERVARLVGADPRDIVFTSGATESNNLVLLGVARRNADRGRHIVTSRIEHKAVLDPCKQLEKEGFTVTYLTPDRSGRMDPLAVKNALRADTVLVSLMHANNEIGVIQDIEAMGALCRERGVAFHTDAAQSAGKLELNLQRQVIDFVSFTAHKLYGPKGIGAVYVRRAARPLLQAIMYGGGQEHGLRPGTLPVSQIVGFGVACDIARRLRNTELPRIEALRDQLWSRLSTLDAVHLNGAEAPRIAGILNVSFEGIEGESLVTALPSLAVSTSAACSSDSGEPSYVLRALGRNTQLAESSLRFSLGRFTTTEEIDRAAELVRAAVERLRTASPKAWISRSIRALHPERGPPPARADGVGTDASAHQPCAEPRPHAGIPSSSPPQGERPFGPIEGETLSPLARDYFEALPRAGIFEGLEGSQTLLTGEAGAEGRETWVRFHLLIAGDTVKDARFQAYGCPHTLAVAAWLAAQLSGLKRGEVPPGGPFDWARSLQVPAEKLGRLLLVEDALRAATRRWPD